MKVLTPREASIFACLVDTVVDPAPPLPPVAATDAVRAFDAWLAAAPAANRTALRAALYAAEFGPRLAGFHGRLRELDRDARVRFATRTERSRRARQLVEVVRSTAALSYYGDAGVMRALGYDADARLRQ